MNNDIRIERDYSRLPTWGDHIMTSVFILITAAFIAAAWMYGSAQQEIVECNQWQAQAIHFPKAFYLTQWQTDQCASHGIKINAPIK